MKRVPAALLALVVASVAGAGELAAASLPPCCSAGSPCAPAAAPGSVAEEARVMRVERRSDMGARPAPARRSEAVFLPDTARSLYPRRPGARSLVLRPLPLRL